MAVCGHCGSSHPPDAEACPKTGEPMARPGPCGTRVDRYDLHALIGVGGFGTVYRATHAILKQPVALKLLRPELAAVDPGALDRLLREARAAAAIGHPNIIRVLDCGVTPEGRAFLVMEELTGADLKEVTARGAGPMPSARAVGIVLQVLEALAAAHAAGIVHRDLKPANVFLCAGDAVKLVDFGISKMAPTGSLKAMTLPGMAMGTPAYMAPEQFESARDVDARADLYSAAAILYELLSGRLPFAARSYPELVLKVQTERPAPLATVAPEVPALLAAVVDRGLARDADARWQSAGELAGALRAALAGAARGGHALAAGTPTAALGATAPAGPGAIAHERHRSTAPAMASFSSAQTTPSSPRPGAARRPVRTAVTTVVAVALAGAIGSVAVLIGLAVTKHDRRAAAADATPAPASATAPAPDAAPAPAPAPRAKPPKPKPAAATVTVTKLVVTGTFKEAAVRHVIARAGLATCLTTGRREVVTVDLFVQSAGTISIAQPSQSNNRGDKLVAACVAARIKAAVPPNWDPGGSGIAAVEVTLAPR